jgi:hypothetical protein
MAHLACADDHSVVDDTARTETGTSSSGARAPVGDDQGGDPACWLDRVCEECGGFITDAGECACAPAG